jgi:hypothetical protein
VGFITIATVAAPLQARDIAEDAQTRQEQPGGGELAAACDASAAELFAASTCRNLARRSRAACRSMSGDRQKSGIEGVMAGGWTESQPIVATALRNINRDSLEGLELNWNPDPGAFHGLAIAPGLGLHRHVWKASGNFPGRLRYSPDGGVQGDCVNYPT